MRKSLSAIAKEYGTTTPSLRAWKAEGVDIYNPAALAARIAARQPSAPTESGSDMQRAKLRKLLAEAQLAEMRADQQSGKLIALDDICQCLTKIGCALKANLGKMRAELPVMLYGRNQAEMAKCIADAVDKTLQGIVDELEQIKIDPPRGE